MNIKSNNNNILNRSSGRTLSKSGQIQRTRQEKFAYNCKQAALVEGVADDILSRLKDSAKEDFSRPPQDSPKDISQNCIINEIFEPFFATPFRDPIGLLSDGYCLGFTQLFGLYCLTNQPYRLDHEIAKYLNAAASEGRPSANLLNQLEWFVNDVVFLQTPELFETSQVPNPIRYIDGVFLNWKVIQLCTRKGLASILRQIPPGCFVQIDSLSHTMGMFRTSCSEHPEFLVRDPSDPDGTCHFKGKHVFHKVADKILECYKAKERTLALTGFSICKGSQAVSTVVHPDRQDPYGDTELMLAAEQGHVEHLNRLIRKRAPVNQINQLGSSALMHASESGSHRAVRTLIQAGANVDETNPKDSGKSALHLAARSGHTRVVHTLIKAQVNLQTTDHHGHTALDHAIKGKHVHTIRVLRDSGAWPKEATEGP